MAVIDFNTDPDWAAGNHDVVIVGAGAAGLFLASLLCKRFRVLVIETGHLSLDPALQQLNQVEFTGKPLLSAVDGRKRAVGGTTLAWGGQSLPFSQLDFEHRPWVPNSGWPIDGRSLWRHYQNANRAMGIDDLDYEDEIFRQLGIQPLPFDREQIRFHFSKWAPDPNFRRIFAREIDEQITVLCNCSLADVELEGANVRAVICRNRQGDSRRFPCSRLILAAGGLESVRLVLWMQARHRFLPPESARRLGTGFMEHPSIYAGAVTTAEPYRFQKSFNTQVWRRRRYSIRLSAAEKWQRRHRHLNVTAAFVMQRPDDAFDPYTEFRDFAKVWATRGALRLTAASLGATAWALARDRFIYKHGASPTLSICAEQEPSSASSLRLADTSDAFGMPRLSLHWDLSPATWQTIAAFAAVVGSEISRLGLGRLELRPELKEASAPRVDLLYDIGHHMGGTAMGERGSHSVVDPDLKLQGLSNAWLCSGSVFPTGSHSNPTLTVLALADRLAEHLVAES
jgi:glycine/D-amino acid oxidase-like deaminating enzyme